MKNKSQRRMLLSFVTLLLCSILLILTTYVLFSDTAVIQNHLAAGDLQVTLVRTDLKGKIYGVDGLLKEYHNPGRIDFSTPTEENIFDIKDGIYAAPGIEYNATLDVINLSDITFGYYIEIVVDEKSSKELCSQIVIKITSGDKEISGTLASLTLGSENDFVSILDVGYTSTFNVELYFIDDDSVNNSAMDQKVYFDLVVHAVQVTSSQNSSSN